MKTILNFLRTIPTQIKSYQNSRANAKHSRTLTQQAHLSATLPHWTSSHRRPARPRLASGLVECVVCYSLKPTSDFPSRCPSDACTHEESEVCRACLREWIKSEFEGNVLWKDLIHCPSCGARLEFGDVWEFGGREVFEKYDAHLLRRALAQTVPNFRWCHNPRCKSGEEYPQFESTCSADPLVTCSSCSAEACFTHNMPWHYGRSCAEFDRLVENVDSEKAINGDYWTRMCPICSTPISKTGGCDQMRCLCGYGFNWKQAPKTMRRGTKLV